MTKRAFHVITVNGRNISETVAPLLIRLSVSIKSGDSGDSVSIELDDRGGQIEMPEEGAKMEVALGWLGSGSSVVFKGKVDDVRSKGGRGNGRILSISAKSVDTNSKAKEPRDKHKDDASLEDAAKHFAKDTGVTKFKIDPEFASLKRAWWGMQNESFINWAQRTAKEIGASFKIVDDTAVLAKRNGGKNADGKSLPTIIANFNGGNGIEWDIAPVLGRPRFKRTRARFFDAKEGKWKTVDVEVPDEGAKADHVARSARADKDEAEKTAKSDKSEAERNKGEGTVVIDGDAAAEPEGLCVVVGARSGIDMAYRIESVDHDFDRSGGWKTKISVKQPNADGKKKKASKKKSGGSGESSGSSSGIDWGAVANGG